jgi:hypothetical protein
MSVIIDQFEIIMDSHNEQQQNLKAEENAVQQPEVIRPHAVATLLEQMRGRADRVRAH